MVCRLLWAKGILALDSRETSTPPFNYLKRLELRTLTIVRDYQIISFDLGPIYRARPTSPLFFSSSCNDPLKLPRCIAPSLAKDVFHIPIPLSICEPLVQVASLTLMWAGFPYMLVFNLVISLCQSLSCLSDYQTSQQNLESRRKFVPPTHIAWTVGNRDMLTAQTEVTKQQQGRLRDPGDFAVCESPEVRQAGT